jgi:hypothetical protein
MVPDSEAVLFNDSEAVLFNDSEAVLFNDSEAVLFLTAKLSCSRPRSDYLWLARCALDFEFLRK